MPEITNSNNQTESTQKKWRVRKKNEQADFIKPDDIVRIKSGVDKPMLAVIIILLCFGLVMVFSASYACAYQKYGNSYYYIIRQSVFALGGLVAMAIVSRILDYRWLRKISPFIFMVSSFLMILVPFIGISKGDAKRWLNLGLITIQPSEIMKFGLVCILAWFMAKYQYKITDYSNIGRCTMYGIIYPCIIIGFVAVLIMVEHHFSCLIISILIGFAVIFAGGAMKLWLILSGVAASLVVFVTITVSSYARERLDIWLHPENYSSLDENYQTLQGLYAVGSGGVFGKGLGNSTQKHLYLSEPMNDFIFSIVCEELGMLGALAVVALFAVFIIRGIHIARNAPDTFSSLVALGIVVQIGLQAILNIMVVTAMIPNTGISLPFFSYGGTALLMQLGEMGILLGISKYSYAQNGSQRINKINSK